MDNRQLSAFVGAIPLPVIAIGADERIVAANAGAEALLGVGGASAGGAGILGRHHLLALRHPDLQSAIARALRDGQGGIARHVVQGPSADTVYRVTVAALGAEGLAILTFEDVTEAEQMGQMRRDFVANVSHELRTPLTAFTGFIETLRGAARNDAAARDRFLAIMEREAARMNRLVSDLLNLSRVEAVERMRPTGSVDLAALVRAVISGLRPVADAAGVTVEQSGEPGPLPIPADADQITQVMTNLIENAVKYGGAGKVVTVHLSRDTLPKGGAVRVDVIDRGEGIDAVHLPRLTERFYRVDSHRSREQGGTGLGLAIVKHIVNRHRGRLKIESEKGKGSIFSILLPES